MTVRPPGSLVTITYDVNGDEPSIPREDDWLVTWSERTQTWGTAYLIISARRVRSTVHPCRFSLRCRKIGSFEQAGIRSGDRVFEIVWYPRKRKSKRVVR